LRSDNRPKAPEALTCRIATVGKDLSAKPDAEFLGKGRNLDISVIRPSELTDIAVERWAALQAADPALDTPFLSPHWARAVETAQGEKSGLRVAVIGEGDGFLAVRKTAFSAMPCGAPMNDYQGVVAAPGVPVDAVKLVQALGVGRLDFSHMLQEQAAFAPFSRGKSFSWVIDVADGYCVYETARRAETSALKDIDKKRRKVERELGPVRFTAWSQSCADLDQLLAWKRGQWQATGQTDLFDTPWTLNLVRGLFESRGPEFGGVLFTLHIGERLAAAQLDLRGNRTIHSWIIAHDAEFERYSPGLILFQDILRWMDDTPYASLDLGAGDYRFKRELSNAQRFVSHGFVGVASPASLVRQAAYGLRAAAESLPLGQFSQLPGKAMRRLDLMRGLR
jgi:CelD/BcsL family acetyltransferase involved in cellulose biosynthesis